MIKSNPIKILFLCAILLTGNVFGGVAKYGNEFLLTGFGVRGMSLGGNIVADPEASVAAYWNPAALAGNQVLSGQLMHSEEFAGVLNLDHISFALPEKNDLTFGMAFIRSGVDDIPMTLNSLVDVGSDGIGPSDDGYSGPDSDGSEGNGQLDPGERLDFGKIGFFGASENALFMSAAKQWSPNLKIGASSKIIIKDLYEYTGWGVGFDLGAQYSPVDNLSLGLVLRDITTTFLFWPDSEKEVIVPSIESGVTYVLQFNNLPFRVQPYAGLFIDFDGEKYNADVSVGGINLSLTAGLELLVKERIFLRFGRDQFGGMQIGTGLNTPLGTLDYGFALGGQFTELGNSHRLGLSLNFSELGESFKKWF